MLCACGQPQSPTALPEDSDPKSGLDQIPDAGPCDRFQAPQAVATVIESCTGCTISDLALAFDGDRQTYALMQIPANPLGSGTLAIRVGGSGVQAPQQLAGAFISWEVSQTEPFVGEGFDVNTYLTGTAQETIDSKHGIVRSGTGEEYAGGTATKPFDEVELKLFQPTQTAATLRVHEFCRDGG